MEFPASSLIAFLFASLALLWAKVGGDALLMTLGCSNTTAPKTLAGQPAKN
jgi:hypothetical protein